MHIGINLLVLTSRPPGGTGYHAISLFEALVEAQTAGRARATITGFAAQEAAGYFSAQARNRLHLLPSGDSRHRIMNELLRLPLAARRAGIDMMVNPAFLGAPWGSPKRALIIHDLYFRSDPLLVPPRRRFLLRTVMPILGRASDPIVAVSGATKAQLDTYYPALGARTTIVYSGIRALRDSASPTRPTPHPYLLIIGHLTANKSPEVVIAALAALRRTGRDITLIHIGDDGGRLGPLASMAGVSANVTTLGRQPDEVLATYYAHCEALVIPSIREGFGLPLIEAQAQGAPVIASSCEALMEIGGTSALFFPVDDALACQNAILTILDDPARRNQLIERGYDNAARFRWDRTAEQLLDALEKSQGRPLSIGSGSIDPAAM